MAEEEKKLPEETWRARESTEKESPKEPSFWGEVLRFAIIATLIVLPIRLYIAQPFIVSGASMSPTFEGGDYLIVDEISYRLEKPERGDVIVFRFPENPSTFFIKRIIGLPNEELEIRNGKVLISRPDGTALAVDESYLDGAFADASFGPVLLGYDEYFVMGDNRGASADSRIWGALPKKYIIGKALVRLFPLSKIDLFPGVADDAANIE